MEIRLVVMSLILAVNSITVLLLAIWVRKLDKTIASTATLVRSTDKIEPDWQEVLDKLREV